MKYIHLLYIIILLFSCENNLESLQGENGNFKELQKKIKSSQINEKIYPEPIADIDELEREINNGGFNQYFFNSSGNNCFKTLELLKNSKNKSYNKLALLLEKAIKTINTEKLNEEKLLEKIQRRELNSLENDSINDLLYSLDKIYYEN